MSPQVQAGPLADLTLPTVTDFRGFDLADGAITSPLARRRQSARFAIKLKNKILLLRVSDVVAVQAEKNYVLLQRESRSYLLRESISAVADKLERYGFIRIHRGVLVNVSFVEEVKPLPTGDYSLLLSGGREYTATRTYKKNLRYLAEFCIGTRLRFDD